MDSVTIIIFVFSFWIHRYNVDYKNQTKEYLNKDLIKISCR